MMMEEINIEDGKKPLEENQFILFSSSLNRYITVLMIIKIFLVNLSCHYQLL